MNAPAPESPRYPRAAAISVAKEICDALRPACLKLKVAGSLRRLKAAVKDVEVIYISKTETRAADLLATFDHPLVDDVLADLEKRGVLARRQNVKGSEMFGPKNKYMVHVASGIPVDLFSSDENSWWNYVVCRTGPSTSNIAIATAAKAKGYKWNPYGTGFSRAGDNYVVTCEEDVFAFVGLPYLPPERRA